MVRYGREGEGGRERRRRHPFHPLPIRWQPGNGIANPTTLHASWQLVISRPFLRQHTPSYRSPPPPLLLLPRLCWISLSRRTTLSSPGALVRSLEQITRTRINCITVKPFLACMWRRRWRIAWKKSSIYRFVISRKGIPKGTRFSLTKSVENLRNWLRLREAGYPPGKLAA